MSLQRGINLKALAEKMGQCSGAEVRGICTEAGSYHLLNFRSHDLYTKSKLWNAGMYALRERRQHVTQEDFEFAVAKVRFIFPVVVVSIARCPSLADHLPVCFVVTRC